MQGLFTQKMAWSSALAALVMAASPAFAQHAGKKDKSANGEDASARAADSNGSLRPVTPEEASVLVEGISRYVDQSTDGLALRQHADGSTSIDYDERFQTVVLARAGVDGKASARCVSTVPEATSFLANNARTPAKKAVRASKTAKAATAKAARETKPPKLTVANRAPLEER